MPRSSCIDGDLVSRNEAYLIIAHISKFVRPAVRSVKSTGMAALSTVAFRNANVVMVKIVLNTSNKEVLFNISDETSMLNTSIPESSEATLVW